MNYLLEGAQTDRLSFRKLVQTDFGKWLPFHLDPLSTVHWSGGNLDPEIACQNWFDTIFYRYRNGLGGMNALIEKDSGSLVGLCGLLVQTVDDVRELEIGYSILPQYRNNGFASEAANTCKDHAFENHWAKSLISIIHIANAGSQKVAKNIGMALEKTTLYKDNPVRIFRVLH